MERRLYRFIKIAPENPVLWTGMKGAILINLRLT